MFTISIASGTAIAVFIPRPSSSLLTRNTVATLTPTLQPNALRSTTLRFRTLAACPSRSLRLLLPRVTGTETGTQLQGQDQDLPLERPLAPTNFLAFELFWV